VVRALATDPTRPKFSISRSCAASCVARAATSIHDVLVMESPPPPPIPPPLSIAKIPVAIDEKLSDCWALAVFLLAFELLVLTGNILSIKLAMCWTRGNLGATHEIKIIMNACRA
jgi:hypothetical protein